MKNRTNIFVSVVLLIVYGTLTFVAVPLHHHEDSLFATGSGNETFVQHDDALHCHHHLIESHDDCTVCSISTHSVFSIVVTVLPHDIPRSAEYSSSNFSFVHQDVSSSHSHRGPPVTFA